MNEVVQIIFCMGCFPPEFYSIIFFHILTKKMNTKKEHMSDFNECHKLK